MHQSSTKHWMISNCTEWFAVRREFFCIAKWWGLNESWCFALTNSSTSLHFLSFGWNCNFFASHQIAASSRYMAIRNEKPKLYIYWTSWTRKKCICNGFSQSSAFRYAQIWTIKVPRQHCWKPQAKQMQVMNWKDLEFLSKSSKNSSTKVHWINSKKIVLNQTFGLGRSRNVYFLSPSSVTACSGINEIYLFCEGLSLCRSPALNI